MLYLRTRIPTFRSRPGNDYIVDILRKKLSTMMMTAVVV
jgi:hypothetical protein